MILCTRREFQELRVRAWPVCVATLADFTPPLSPLLPHIALRSHGHQITGSSQPAHAVFRTRAVRVISGSVGVPHRHQFVLYVASAGAMPLLHHLLCHPRPSVHHGATFLTSSAFLTDFLLAAAVQMWWHMLWGCFSCHCSSWTSGTRYQYGICLCYLGEKALLLTLRWRCCCRSWSWTIETLTRLPCTETQCSPRNY